MAPSCTETACALGLTGNLVAVNINDGDPPQIAGLPKLDNIHPDWEALVALEPQAVLVEESICTQGFMERMQALHLNVVSLRTETLGDLYRNLPEWGRRLHCSERALELRRTIGQQMSQMRQHSAAMAHHPSVYIDVFHSPLISAAQNSLCQELVELAGGRNIFADLPSAYPTISAEELIKRAPQIAVLTSISAAQAKEHPVLGRLEAVRAGRIIELNPSLLQRPTPRCLEGAKILQAYFERWNAAQDGHPNVAQGERTNVAQDEHPNVAQGERTNAAQDERPNVAQGERTNAAQDERTYSGSGASRL